MNKFYTLVALLIVGVVTLNGGVQVFAQSYESSISDTQLTVPSVSDSCSISGYPNSSDTSNIDTTDYTISYQGGGSTPISTDVSIYPTLSYTPRITTTDATFSVQDTNDTTITRDMLAYPTKIYSSSTTNSDVTINYLDAGSIFLNTDTSSYPRLSVTSDTTLSYPSISFQANEPTLVNTTTVTETTPVESTNSCTVSVDSDTQYSDANITVDEPPIVYPDPISANLSVNDEYIIYVDYGDSATVKWESTGTSSCSLDPISQSGTEGEYVLHDMTSNIAITIDCEAAPGYANYQISPEWLARVEVKVLPPTFGYLESYLTGLQPTSKKVNLKSTSNFVDQAKRVLEQGNTDRAQAFLQKSTDSLKQQESKGLPNEVVEKYVIAVNYLSSTLPVTVVIASDGCSVTANGSPGLILQYGANENMRRGYGEEAVIPDEGSITKTIYAPNGFTATGEVVDSTGLIYARDTKDVTTADCPEPPFVYDPTLYNGYPEKWAVPEPGTVIDDWGYFNKTAESYVAFRVTDSGRTFPTSYGDGSEWLVNAIAENLVVDIPQAGDVAVNIIPGSLSPVVQYIDSVDVQGNVQMTSFSESPDGSYSGSFGGSGGTIEDFSSYMKFIRFP